MTFQSAIPTADLTDVERGEEWRIMVCAWRGYCIDVFSRAECSISDCIAALQQAGVEIGKDAFHQGAGTRLRALKSALENDDFSGHQTVALERIEEWMGLHEIRSLLAHGTVTATKLGIKTAMQLHNGKTRQPLVREITGIEMLKLARQLEEVQRGLHQQLGQIKAAALKRAA